MTAEGTFPKVDGDILYASEVNKFHEDSNGANNSIIEHEIEIFELQANASITPFDHDSIISDTFSDSGGYGDSVNTGNTTATFDTNKYKRINHGGQATDTIDSGYSTNSQNIRRGVKFSVSNVSNLTLTQVVKSSATDATTCELLDATGGTLLSSQTFSGNNATFNYTLTAGTTYIIIAWSGYITSYTGAYKTDSYPKSETNDITFLAGAYDNGDENPDSVDWVFPTGVNSQIGIISITTTVVSPDEYVEINLPTISGTVTDTELIIRDSDRESGDNITYKLEDASANTDEDLELETMNALTNLVSNPTILRINLIATGTSPTTGSPAVKTFALKLWKS